MTIKERNIIDGLIARDERITRKFFYTECRPMLNGLIHNMFRDNADYDELVNELYCHLLKNDAHVLRTFGQRDGDTITEETQMFTLFKWLKKTAWRFFVDKAIKTQSIEERRAFVYDDDGERIEYDPKDTSTKDPCLEMDVNTYLRLMKIPRDREVLKKYFLDDMDAGEIAEELGISTDNLYTIKKRALERLQSIARHATGPEALCAVICEQYALDMFGIHKSLEFLRDFAQEQGLIEDSGMALENIGKISASFELSVTSGKYTLEELSVALDEGKQVIVAVDGGELIGDQTEELLEDKVAEGVSDHCVVVLSCHPAEGSLSLYDPAYGKLPLFVEIEQFDDAWKDSERFAVIVDKS